MLGSGTIETPETADGFAAKWKSAGAVAASCIAGFGYESDAEMDLLVESIFEASSAHHLPIYLETHRGSITQDAWRTVQLAKRTPELYFTGDFSHWFTGQEMAYGNIADRLSFLEAIFSRTALLHGRIGNRCCMQVDICKTENKHIEIFCEMWRRVFRHFLRDSVREHIWYCPELLGPKFDYARTFLDDQGHIKEETDRWTQAHELARLARCCFASAVAQVE